MEQKDFEKVIEVLENVQSNWYMAISKILDNKEERQKRLDLIQNYTNSIRESLKVEFSPEYK